MSALYDLFRDHPRVTTDSRHIEPGGIFFALKGERFDGNRFAAESLRLGAAFAVADDPALRDDPAAREGRLIVVDDALGTLQELAREHRRELGIPVLAVTGSNGKTTTKELLRRVLSERFTVLATGGNLNNHIGVPLTLLSLTREAEFAVVEMGASARGEIALLASIAEPNYGLITNIGRAHLDGFGGPEGVRRGKGELFDFLRDNGGRAFVAAEDATLTAMAREREPMAVEYYSLALADDVPCHLEGEYNRANVAAAVAVGRYFGIAEERILHAVDSYVPTNNRSQRMLTERNTLILDCYNANPSSMQAALDNFLVQQPDAGAGKAVILGDMLELGDWSRDEHRHVVRLAARDTQARILLVGEHFAEACRSLDPLPPNVTCFPTRQELEEHLDRNPLSGSLILVKGSRGIGLEHLTGRL
jgi:UDP-N-acetylmuramoyl-tripeptide--D-alanyl-D-alanine ligase